MAITNNLVVFGESTTNVMDKSGYDSNSQRTNGVQSGEVISSQLHNTVLKNVTIIIQQMVASLIGLSTNSSNVTFDVAMSAANAKSGFDSLFAGLSSLSASKWTTARNFSITSGDGSSTSVDGSGDVVLKLPATITATLSGSSSSCSGNATTSTKLQTARKLKIASSDGSGATTGNDFDGSSDVTILLPSTIKASITGNCSGSSGSCSGNAATATKLATERTISLSGDVSGSFTFDGSADKSFTVDVGQGKITDGMLAGSISNGKLANSSITIGSNVISLGSSVSSLSGLTSVSSTSFTTTSDIRLKKNIKEFTPRRSILDLNVVEYDMKKDKSHHIGCIAQDLRMICPELVHEDEKGMLSIEENKLVYLLLLEVKKLKKQLDDIRG